jgi:hypothetical protein
LWVRRVIASNDFALGMSVAPQKRRLFARIDRVVKGQEETHALQKIANVERAELLSPRYFFRMTMLGQLVSDDALHGACCRLSSLAAGLTTALFPAPGSPISSREILESSAFDID